MVKPVTEKPHVEEIFVLFSVNNNYDQPENNMVAWWSQKPSLHMLAQAMGYEFPSNKDDVTLAIVKVWSGEHIRMEYDGTRFRMETVKEGQAI